MTSTPVQYVLDELGAVVDAQPEDHPLRRVDRDNALLYGGGGNFDMGQSVEELQNDLQDANYVGARFADRDRSYIGTTPDADLETVVGVRVLGYSGSYGHADPAGQDGVPFAGSDGALVEQIQSALYDGLKFPDAGRTDVAFTHLSITNESPVMGEWSDFHQFSFDVVFDGFEHL